MVSVWTRALNRAGVNLGGVRFTWSVLTIFLKIKFYHTYIYIDIYMWNTLYTIRVIACVASVSVRFRSKERGTRVKDRAKNCFISCAAKTENPVPRSFFAPKPNGNACYAGYKGHEKWNEWFLSQTGSGFVGLSGTPLPKLYISVPPAYGFFFINSSYKVLCGSCH